MKKITINHVTRIEGHAKITIRLDDEGQVAGTQFHVTQVRGFEKFIEGRPFYEMPSITSRICGICPVSHLLASSKACDEIMAVRVPTAAAKLRELLHCAQFVQSHALSFFHLSAPDLLLGMDFDPARRNVAGMLVEHPDLLRDGIYELRAKKGHVNYRLLYFFHGRNVAIVAHDLTKEGVVPVADIDRAVRRKQAFEAKPERHTYRE